MSATEVNGTVPKKATVLADELERPELDDRKYRVIRLENGLEALIVHDPNTDKASAALDVRVGNYADVEDLPGQAHAVEHLLFMGTEKYPAENEYSSFLSENGGHSNAYTASMETNYYFELSKFHLKGALDRFAQFFISPLFREDCLDRELRAVDSENKKNLQNDTWRLYQLSKTLSNPRHPFSKFNTGSLVTLKEKPESKGVNVREEFMKFHERHYSANQMKLVVLGQEDLDTLQEWVETMFADVKNKNLTAPSYPEEPLTENELLTIVTAKPVMDTRSLEFTFPFLSEDKLFRTFPSRYISHLIGHEGPGSILAYLKAKGWATGLSAGPTPITDTSAFFQIDIKMTISGLENWKEITKVVFQYINMIKELPPQEWVFKELQQIAAIDFRFRQKEPASSFTSHLASVMHKKYPREWLLSGGSLLREWNPEHIKQAFEYLRADNFRLTIITQVPPSGVGSMDQREKWYGTEYRVDKIPQELLDTIKAQFGKDAPRIPELHMPHRNLFIPSNFHVERKEVKEPAKAPTLIRNTESLRVWHKKDDTFWVPKACVYITIRNPLVYSSPSTHVRTKVYCDLVRDALSEYAYDAEISGLEYSLLCHLQGMDVEVAGYNDKLPVLLEKVLTIFKSLELREDRFNIVKERMIRGVKNWEFIQPYKQVGEYMRFLNHERYWLNEDMKSELELLTLDDVARFRPELFAQIHFETFVHGNLYKEDALRLSDLVANIFKPRVLPHTQFVPRRTVLPPRGRKFAYPRLLKDPKNVNSCIEYFLFVNETTDRRSRALLSLFAQVAEEPAFDQLRTKEQLGYIVWSGFRSFGSTNGFRVLVQSEKSVAYLEHRIEAFLAGFEQNLEKMTDKEFQAHRSSLISRWTEKPKHLMQESNFLWAYIENENYDFLRTDIESEIVKQIKKEELVEFYKEFIHPASPRRAQLSVHMVAASQTEGRTPVQLNLPEQKTLLSQAVAQLLGTDANKVDVGRLGTLFANLDTITKDTTTPVLRSFLDSSPLKETEKTSIIERFGAALTSILPKETGGQLLDDELYKYGKPELIEDGCTWKAELQLSAASRPVKPLVEFEESSVKL